MDTGVSQDRKSAIILKKKFYLEVLELGEFSFFCTYVL